MTRLLALCADDYGLSPAIDAGILRLLRAGRLTAVSCIVNGPRWPGAARLLRDEPAVAHGAVSAGLHFNLTEGWPLSATLAARWPQLPSLAPLLLAAHTGWLDERAIGDELQAQYSAWDQAFGVPPGHLDGHQHVHHLPVVRAAVLALLATRPALRVRDTGRPGGPGHLLKRAVIAATGGWALGRRLRVLGAQANSDLLGIYDFRDTDYRALMRHWLARLPARGGLIFCHPGAAGGDAADPIAAARSRELDYLAGPDFAADLAAAGVQLGVGAPRR